MANYKLSAQITANISDFVKKLDEASGELKKTSDNMKDIGGKMSLGVTAPVMAAGAASVKFASDYNESLNKVDVAFGSSADKVEAWSKTTIQSAGLAGGSALEMASLFGDMATSMGLPQGSAADMSMSLTQLGGDLASFKNIGIDEAQTALSGIFTGETESLKRLGVVMTQTNLDAYAMAKGFGKTTDEMTEAEKVQLRYSYVLDATKNAQGDYARTADGTANSMRTFQETLKELATTFGQNILPVITPIIQKLGDMAAKFGEMSPTGQKVVVVLLGIAAAIGPVLSFIGMLIPIIGFFSGAQTANAAATGAAAAATWSFNAAILLIPLAIIAIIAILVLLWKKNEAFRDAVMGVVNAVGGFFQWLGGIIMGAIKSAIDWIMGAFNAFWGFVQPIVTTLGSIFQFVASVIMTAWRVAFTIIQIYIQIWWAVIKFIIDLVASAFKWVADKIWGFIEPVVGWIIEKFQLWWAVTQVMIDLVVGAFNKVKDAIGNAIGSAIETAIGLFNKLKDIVTGVVDSIKNVFGNIGSAISGGINMALDGARSIINKAIGGINSAIGIINAIPGVNVSEIPYLAHGTNNWGGGMAWINEQGRGELVNLPSGAQVIPHDLSKRMIDQYARTSASMQNQTITDDDRTINATSTPVNLYLDSKKVAEGSFDTIYEMLTQRKKVESR